MLKRLDRIEGRAKYLDRAFPNIDDILNAAIEKEFARLKFTPAQREKFYEGFKRDWEQRHSSSFEASRADVQEELRR